MFGTVADTLGAEPAGDDLQRFDLGEHLTGAWGGLHGGAVAAAMVVAGRSAVGDNSPSSIDARFTRPTQPGVATVRCRVVSAGRTLTSVALELEDCTGRTTAAALATYADRARLQTDVRTAPDLPALSDEAVPRPEADDVGSGARITELCGCTDNYYASGNWMGWPVSVPWGDLATSGPEFACFAADFAQGGAGWEATGRGAHATPNPDLSLRFTTAELGRDVVGFARPVGVADGFATIETLVSCEDRLLARALSTCAILPLG